MNPKVFLILFLTILLASILTNIVIVKAASESKNIFIEQTGTVGFQADINKTVMLTVLSGNLSGSNCRVYFTFGEGYFSFHAENDTTIRVDAVNIQLLSAKGDSGKEMRRIDNGDVLTVVKENIVVIKWGIGIVDNLSWLIMPMLGMFGFFSTGFGCFYVGDKIRKRDAFGAIRGCLVAMVFILIGVGLIIGWLW